VTASARYRTTHVRLYIELSKHTEREGGGKGEKEGGGEEEEKARATKKGSCE